MFRVILLTIVVATMPLGTVGAAAQLYQSDFPPEEFEARWAKVYDHIGDNGIAFFAGTPQVRGFNVPRQTNNFYYLSGIETPYSYMVLDGRTREATLYLPPRNERLERSEGKTLSADDADLVKELTGADHVASTADMGGDWIKTLLGSPMATVYTPFAPAEGYAESRYEIEVADAGVAADYWDGRVSRERRFRQLIGARVRNVEIRDLTPLLDHMRLVKSEREIALIRRASELAALGILEALKSSKPGVWEYQLDAAARYVFLANGAKLDGYRSITASGINNIFNGHYYKNNSQLKAGDLVLMDYAPDYRYYVSDVTRMWPVDGTYRPWQRALLQATLYYRDVIIKRIKPGLTPQEIMDDAAIEMKPLLAGIDFASEAHAKAAQTMIETGGGVF